MRNISYEKACKSCNTTTGARHVIMWQDDNELQINGDLISESEMIKKILDYHYEANIKCPNCGAINIWDIWNVQIDGNKLRDDNEPGLQLDLGGGRIVQYTFYQIATIINNATKRLDLGLTNLETKNDFSKIGIKISIMETMTIMNIFFETRLLPSPEVYDFALNYFSNYFQISYSKNELTTIKDILSDWEFKILYLTPEDIYDFREYSPELILPKIYSNIPTSLQNQEVYNYFKKQYFQTRQFITFYLIKKFDETGLENDSIMANSLNKLIPTLNKL